MNKQEKTMTNDELKKKIVDIALHAEWMDMFGDHNSIGKYAANAIADALIAAGIGDVNEWKAYAKVHRIVITKDDKIKQLYSNEEVDKIVIERAEYKHRAEVAEKMFDILHEESSMYMKVFSKEWYKQQAEKELAEEEGQ